MNQRTATTLACVVTAVLGLASLYSGATHATGLTDDGTTAVGRITSIDDLDIVSMKPRRSGRVHHYEYRDTEGHTHEGTFRSRSTSEHAVGDPFDVCYDPDRPAEHARHGCEQRADMSRWLFGFAAVLLPVSAVLFWVRRRMRRTQSIDV